MILHQWILLCFYICDLRIIDNYELSNTQIQESVNNPNINISIQTTQVIQTTENVTNAVTQQQIYQREQRIIMEQNYLVIKVNQNVDDLILKTKRHDNINFIKGQRDDNLLKIQRMQDSLRSYQLNYNLTTEFQINKVDNIRYRGLEFSNNVYKYYK